MEVLSFWFIEHNPPKLDEANIAHPFGVIRTSYSKKLGVKPTPGVRRQAPAGQSGGSTSFALILRHQLEHRARQVSLDHMWRFRRLVMLGGI